MILLFFIQKIGFQPPSGNIYGNRSSALFPLFFSFRRRKSGFWMAVFYWFSEFFQFVCNEFHWLSPIFNVFAMILDDFCWFYMISDVFQLVCNDVHWFSLMFNAFQCFFSMIFKYFRWFSMFFSDFNWFSIILLCSFEKSDSNRLPETYENRSMQRPIPVNCSSRDRTSSMTSGVF